MQAGHKEECHWGTNSRMYRGTCGVIQLVVRKGLVRQCQSPLCWALQGWVGLRLSLDPQSMWAGVPPVPQ